MRHGIQVISHKSVEGYLSRAFKDQLRVCLVGHCTMLLELQPYPALWRLCGIQDGFEAIVTCGLMEFQLSVFVRAPVAKLTMSLGNMTAWLLVQWESIDNTHVAAQAWEQCQLHDHAHLKVAQ